MPGCWGGATGKEGRWARVWEKPGPRHLGRPSLAVLAILSLYTSTFACFGGSLGPQIFYLKEMEPRRHGALEGGSPGGCES